MDRFDAPVAWLSEDDEAQQARTVLGKELGYIPEAGLREALEGWSSKGDLWAGLAAVQAERDWSWRDSERRAMRVLFAELIDDLRAWPTMQLDWVEALPAVTHRTRETGPVLRSGVSWPQTRRLGWPPSEFVCRPKSRIADQLLVTALRWTIEALIDVRRSAVSVAPELDAPVAGQLDVAEELLDAEPVSTARPSPPDHSDLLLIAAEGGPWAAMAPVTAALLAIDEVSVFDLARRLIAPTEERWRLFHLAVFGELLRCLRANACELLSQRPLSATTNGPAFTVTEPSGRQWDLWFEAAGAWRWYEVADPYLKVVEGVPGAGGPLGTDIALIRPGERALLIDCQYSRDARVVGRDGYRAALAYAAEARSGLVDETVAAACGPAETIATAGWTDTYLGPVGILAPQHIYAALTDFLTPFDPALRVGS